MDILTRENATALGRKTYYTGEPCKHGHLSPRYTINSACIACMQKHRPRLNPFSKDKVPYAPTKPLWRTRRHTPETLAELFAYLQTCIDTYEASRFAPVCAACQGTHYVPMLPSEPDYTPGKWKWCVACDTPEPSTAT